MTAAAAGPDPLTAVSRTAAPPPGGFVLRRGDWGAFRAAEPGTDDVLLLRPTPAGLRVERPRLFETIAWDDVVGVALTDVRVGTAKIPVVRVLFRRGPSLDLADVLAPGADELPMCLEAGGAPLLRVERLRMVSACVISASGLAPRSREHFHRGGRGIPVPELVARPSRLPPWAQRLAKPAMLVVSVLALGGIVPALRWWGSIGVHVALYVHEMGHAIAMRALGMKVRSIVFLPTLGAATLSEHPFRTRWDDVRVALAGPFTGIPIALVTLGICHEPPPTAVQWGLVVSVVYGALNLVPLVPMDGGRVLLSVAAGLPPVVRTLLTWAPLAAAIALLYLAGPGEITLTVAALVAFGILMTRLALRRLDFHQWVLDARLDPAAMRAALRDLTWGFHGAARDDVDGGVPPTPLTAGQTAAAIALHLTLSAALLASAFVLLPLVPNMAGSE